MLPTPCTPDSLAALLSSEGSQLAALCAAAQDVRMQTLGPNVYLRGLIELSNRCQKNCYYCGIRREAPLGSRYELDEEQVVKAARYAHRQGYASLAIQAGERSLPAYAQRITQLIHRVADATKGELGITLSLGEQTPETYYQWRMAGADRYLLRIETSSEQLYATLHPNDGAHCFAKRVACLTSLRALGYQVGTGVMVGLPGQTLTHLADDLLWMRGMDIDMVGMGPYIEHPHTPLYALRHQLWPASRRLEVSIAMVAALRLLMPAINIAATTAMQTLHPQGRMRALEAGANVIMPNITPQAAQTQYSLYRNKMRGQAPAADALPTLQAQARAAGCAIALGLQGNSLHHAMRVQSSLRNAQGAGKDTP